MAPPAGVIITDLPASNTLCTRKELKRHTLQTVQQAGVPNTVSAVYFIDGCVDPEMGRTTVAEVTGGKVLSWRTLHHCTTLQAKLVAVHTDSKAGLQALQQP